MIQLLLLADGDWVKLATFLVIGTFYLISFLAGKLRDRQVAKNRAPQRPPKADGADAIAGELDEFLKKAQKRDPTKQPVRPVATPVVAAPRSEGRKPRRRGDDRGDPTKRRTLAAPLPTLTESRAKDDAQRKRSEGVEEHVRHAIDTQKFDQRAAQLGQLDASSQIGTNLQQSFSHQLGTLGPASSPAATAPAAAAPAVDVARSAAPIAALLSGGNLKQAVILKEILERPKRAGLERTANVRSGFLLGVNRPPSIQQRVSMPAPAIVPGKTRLGWIGTGVMGTSMCGHLIDRGYPMTVFNRTKAKAHPLVEKGARWADTPRVVAEASDVVFSIVGFPTDVRDITLGDNGSLAGAAQGRSSWT